MTSAPASSNAHAEIFRILPRTLLRGARVAWRGAAPIRRITLPLSGWHCLRTCPVSSWRRYFTTNLQTGYHLGANNAPIPAGCICRPVYPFYVPVIAQCTLHSSDVEQFRCFLSPVMWCHKQVSGGSSLRPKRPECHRCCHAAAAQHLLCYHNGYR